MCHSSTDKIFQSALTNPVTFVEIDGSPLIALKSGIEELVWIRNACALSEGELYLILVSVGHQDQSSVRPTWTAHPFPFLDCLWIGITNNFANIGKHFAAPVSKLCDSFINESGCIYHANTS